MANRCQICGGTKKYPDLPALLDLPVDNSFTDFIMFTVEGEILCYFCFIWAWKMINGEEFNGGYHVNKAYCRCFDCRRLTNILFD